MRKFSILTFKAIRNAAVHRDYSLTGKDIKVAIYDDMVEITSPGLLPPSIDYAAMESRQIDARNKVKAPVFKKLGIIDQCANGLKLIADEMKEYPNIELRWIEVGLSFQVQFLKRDFIPTQKDDVEINSDLSLSVRQQKAMEYVKEHGSISNKIYQEINNVSKPTATRDLAEIVTSQLLEPQGSGRSAVYVLSAHNRLIIGSVPEQKCKRFLLTYSLVQS